MMTGDTDRHTEATLKSEGATVRYLGFILRMMGMTKFVL